MQYLSTIVTFCVFFLEGLLHFNIGLNSNRTLRNLTLGLPSRRDLFSMVCVLMLFSAINGILIGIVHKYEHALTGKPNNPEADHDHDSTLK